MSKRYFLFDLDGTLSDPYLGISNSIVYAAQKMEIPVSDDYKWCIGPPLQESFSKILQPHGLEGEVEQAVSLFREYFSEKGIFENEIYPGIRDELASLSSQRLFVATSKPHVYAKRIISHFGLESFFEEIYGSELDGVRTNKAELISYLLERESLNPGEGLMIGDRKHDLIGAHKNQMDSVGVLWGYGSPEELSAEKPSLILSTPADISRCLLDR